MPEIRPYIHKFTIDPYMRYTTIVPAHANAQYDWLDVKFQKNPSRGYAVDPLVIWGELRESIFPLDDGTQYLMAIPTGATAPEFGEYIGTAMTDDGAFVLHVYELAGKPE